MNFTKHLRKKLHTMTKWGLTQEWEFDLTFKKSIDIICHVKRIKEKSYIHLSKSGIWQNSNSSECRIRGNVLRQGKGIYKKQYSTSY